MFATHSLVILKNSSWLVSDGGEKSGGVCIAKYLLLFRTLIRERNESQKYVFFQYIEVSDPIDIVDKTLG